MSYKILSLFVGGTPHLTAETFLRVRKGLSLSQSQLASLLEMSRFTVSRIERGIYPISRRLDFAMAHLIALNSSSGLSLNYPRTGSISLPIQSQEESKTITPSPEIQERPETIKPLPIKPKNNHKHKKNKNKRRR